ncbi:MOSC domain-containing protein [Paucibacter sp. Y2R2-4]|uniref:MOSC domain-containing protein n=1 Tax=Paucibacter sp. Y2R2-4 TaxID=2893553 RepID=UPI0021E4BD8F|nr:MOSC domain-containing protein [Paucibacter sp. Y2R2-4]MCV2350993.1 MOSC domain-containing protein [Paucibacter sp. Y2R2-4]
MNPQVLAVFKDPSHRFSKSAAPAIQLLTGLGVEGDAHCGVTVKHRSRVAQDPTQPNLRQVHLIQSELLDELATQGLRLAAGQLGENLSTRGIDLLALPVGTRLRFSAGAEIELTGLRNPCAQIENFMPGLLAAVLGRDAQGGLIRKAGVMAVVRLGGVVAPGDGIEVFLPEGLHRRLERV